MGKFRQLSPELWPLIDVKKMFFALYLKHFDLFSSKCV